MFTGLVEAEVPLLESVVVGPGKRMGFDLGPIADGVQIGDSIALDGSDILRLFKAIRTGAVSAVLDCTVGMR